MFSFVSIFFQNYPQLQVVTVLISSFVMLAIIVWLHPFNEKLLNQLECFNESTLLIVNYCFLFFLDQEHSYEMKSNIGWLLIGISALNTTVNLVIIIYTSF